MPFLNKADYTETGDERNGLPLYKLIDPLSYRWTKRRDLIITVHAGFITDLASIPKPFAWFIPPNSSLWDDAAILHDYACACVAEVKAGKVNRMPITPFTMKDADGLLYDAMRDEGASLFTAMMFYNYVRARHIAQGAG